jgi:hypothetical protein
MTALPEHKTRWQLPTPTPVPQGSGHWIAVGWRQYRPVVRFYCREPRHAWCRRHVVGPGEPPPTFSDFRAEDIGDCRYMISEHFHEDIDECWYTIWASGFDWLSIYCGDPARIDPVCSGAVEFILGPYGAEDWLWRYADDGA